MHLHNFQVLQYFLRCLHSSRPYLERFISYHDALRDLVLIFNSEQERMDLKYQQVKSKLDRILAFWY